MGMGHETDGFCHFSVYMCILCIMLELLLDKWEFLCYYNKETINTEADRRFPARGDSI